MDPELGEKRKVVEERKKSHKKLKAIKDPPVELIDDKYNLLEDTMEKLADETRQKIDSRHIE